MGATKYSDTIIIDLPLKNVLEGIKKILKKELYPIQYENKEKGIIMARIEQKWLAPAGELIIFDLKELATNKVEVFIFSKDLLDSAINFNRNVKNVNRLLKVLENAFN